MATFFIRTYGCQMNERDSELLACLLKERGHTPVPAEDQADVILLNTCSVRDQAERKAAGKAGLLKRLKRQRPGLVIGIIGCMAQAGRTCWTGCRIDLWLGQTSQDIRTCLTTSGGDGVATRSCLGPGICRHESGRPFARVAVMRGCDQYCSTIVPRPGGAQPAAAEIVREEGNWRREESGPLLGQNVTAYGIAGPAAPAIFRRLPSPTCCGRAGGSRRLPGSASHRLTFAT